MALNNENSGPYITHGNAGHPGVQGKPYHGGPIGGFDKIDNPGTGTFPSHMQGTINRAQPAGVSSSAQYGHFSPGSNQGNSPVAAPNHFPIPDEMEGHGVGLAMLKQEQPMVHGVNVPINAEQGKPNPTQEERIADEGKMPKQDLPGVKQDEAAKKQDESAPKNEEAQESGRTAKEGEEHEANAVSMNDDVGFNERVEHDTL